MAAKTIFLLSLDCFYVSGLAGPGKRGAFLLSLDCFFEVYVVPEEREDDFLLSLDCFGPLRLVHYDPCGKLSTIS